MKNYILIFTALTFGLFSAVNAQKTNDKGSKGYGFVEDFRLATIDVPNQYRSGTCWSFSGISFLESELLRIGKDAVNLSEMFVVNHCYYDKAILYVRMHGNLNFGGGGAFHDVTYVMKNYGLVTEKAYPGLEYGTEKHVHAEMDDALLCKVKSVVKNKNKTLSTVWQKGVRAELNAYLGELPENFKFNETNYTPSSFVTNYCELEADDYVELTSFTHHPFYKPFILEIPDNWIWNEVYNVKLNEMIEVIDHALDNGYTIAWAADVSHKGFSYSNDGLAVIPDADIESMDNLERGKWDKLSSKEKSEMLYSFDKPGKEKTITQDMRQKGFDNYSTTDDHGMHIIGKAKDKNGTTYYIVKNSWGKSGKYDGYLYVSVPFIKMQTTDIMVNKNSIPKALRKKLGL
ncbi:MAG: C1 family peptidase [Bacteroidota bacterium]|nr:C1 family peptidase [Bacteroidota bacterium]